MSTLFKHLKGKSLAILGNAESLFAEDRSKEIDKNDVVIRMNKGMALTDKQLEYTTPRCEVYCGSGCGFDLSHRTTNEPERYVWMTEADRKDAPNFATFYPLWWWEELQYRLGESHRPTTGLMVIDMVRRTFCSEVNIFGFDFWDTKTFYNPEIWTPDSYSPKEESMIRGLIDEDNRFTLHE